MKEGININGEQLRYPRFADDIVLIADHILHAMWAHHTSGHRDQQLKKPK